MLSSLEWFTTFRSPGKGAAVIPYFTLAEIEGKEAQAINKNYDPKPFLEQFKVEIADFWEGIPHAGYARTMEILWPEVIKEALAKFKMGLWNWSKPVYLLSGKDFNPAMQQSYINQLRLDALLNNGRPVSKEGQLIIDYINSLPSHLFTGILKYWDQAYHTAPAFEEDKGHVALVLANILSQPQPFVKAVKKSTRLYQSDENLMTVRSEIRRILTQDWEEADLKSCQLAIAAKIWDLPEVVDFLAQSEDVWSSLCGHFGRGTEIKPIIKPAIYALMYGAGENLLSDILDPLGEFALEMFLSHPIIKILWVARNKELKKIRKAGGAHDAFGNWIDKSITDKKSWERSVLCQVNQSYELKLLFPAFKLALENKENPEGFWLPLYQFDGFSFLSNSSEHKLKWMMQITEVVNKEAEELGVPTSLIFK